LILKLTGDRGTNEQPLALTWVLVEEGSGCYTFKRTPSPPEVRSRLSEPCSRHLITAHSSLIAVQASSVA
jgi:hypothetical protein